MGADKRFFPVVSIVVKKFLTQMHPLPAEIMRLIVTQIILDGKFRIKAAMSKKIVICFNKVVAASQKSKVLLRKITQWRTIVGFQQCRSTVSHPFSRVFVFNIIKKHQLMITHEKMARVR